MDKIDLEGKSSIEIDVILDGLEQKLSEEQDAQSKIEQARIDKRKLIAQIRLEILDLDKACEQAGHVISQTKIDIKRCESKKFQMIRAERFQT
jgi:hypothetical protein